MNCQRVQESFIDYQDGTLAPDESAALRAHLSSCPACQREWAALQEITRKLGQLPAPEPGPRLREQFYAMLESHQSGANAANPFALAKGRLDRFFAALMPAQPARQFTLALALLAAGLFAGARFLATAGAGAPALDESTRKELRELHAQVDGMGKLVTYTLLQQKSTGERLQVVLAAMDLKSPDRKVLSELVGALAFDPSVNVRLSAVEALAPHANDRFVRAGLMSALPRESAPLVQLAMIELLTSVHETEATTTFEQLSHDEHADENVREAARRGLAVLRSPQPGGHNPTTNTSQFQPSVT